VIRPSTLPCIVLALTSACASYNQRTEGALRAFEGGRFDEARAAYAEDPEGADFLPAVEAGMVALTAGQWKQALAFLGAAAKAVEEVEREALVSPENAGELLLSWTLNETFKDYKGEGYERVMLHSALALAYLTQGQVEDVLVEVRLANALLETEEELYEADYGAGGLGHYLSAVAYELTGEFDDAYIDYRRLADKGLGGDLAGRALVRLSQALGRGDDLSVWEERYGQAPTPSPDAASVVVIGGVGLGPFKEELTLTLPTGDGLVSWAVPTFRVRQQPVSGLVLSTPTAEVRTQVLEDVGAVATRNLEDRIAWLAAKSTVRTFLKRELRQKLQKEHGAAGALVGDLFNVLTERADLRAWRTLPDTWQAARLFLEPGAHELTLTADGGERVYLGAFELEPGETMFVLARTLGTRLYVYPIGGRPVFLGPADQ
jgi:uncharacterized protein